MHKIILTAGLLLFVNSVKAQQETEPVITPFSFSGSLQITTDGISTIPAFSLGKPAIMVIMNANKKRLSINPMFALGTNGEPWYMLNWLRYNIVDKEKFTLRTSAGYGWAFRDADVISDDDTISGKRAFRSGFLELRPAWHINENSSISLAYMYVRGFENDFNTSIHMLMTSGSFLLHPVNNINFAILPQIFGVYFKDFGNGLFYAANFSISYKEFPLALGSFIAQPFTTTIEPKAGFVWNVNLTYSFK